MAIICAISGFRKSGKTFFSNLIVEAAKEFGLEIKKLSFATPLKQFFCEKRGISGDTMEFYKEDYRLELENFSTECKKEDPLLFTNMLISEILPNDKVIIDDLRLILEEVKPLLDLKTSIYRIYADKKIRMHRGYKSDPINDCSRYETELDLPQDIFRKWGGYYIFNNKDNNKEELIEEAKKIVRRHYLPKPS